jgi:uncharacterized protein (DUF305 family)
MSMHVKHPQIRFTRWQIGRLAVVTALLVAPVFALAHETPTSQPPATSSMPMDHAQMGHMNAHKGMSMTGDVDYDFAVNMRMHHQMALMMSEAQLKNGKDADMREMATQVIAAQKKEIAELDAWIAARDQAMAEQSED